MKQTKVFFFVFLCMSMILEVGFAQNTTTVSKVREGAPLLTFKAIEIPETVQQGEVLPLYVSFYVIDYIPKSLKLFLHLVNLSSGKLIVNADTELDYPTDEWISSEVIKLGPYGIYVPKDLPEGDYGIRCGVMEVVLEENKQTYIREPYSNTDIKDFTVATVKVIKSEKAEAKKVEPLLLSDFSQETHLDRWKTIGAVFAANKGWVDVTFYPGYPFPSFYMDDFFKEHPEYADWSRYDFLTFQIQDEGGAKREQPNVTLQLKDSQERRYKLWLDPKEHYGKTVKIDLAEIANYLNIADIAFFDFYASELKERRGYSVSSIQLVPQEGTTVVDERPFLSFKSADFPALAEAGKSFTLNLKLTTETHVKENYRMFIRLVEKVSAKTFLSAESYPPVASSVWPVGSEFETGPVRVALPQNIPAGEYYIKAGFYTSITIPEGAFYVKHYMIDEVVYTEQPSRSGTDYIKIPYNNKDIVDYIVGQIKITATEQPKT